jgi:hypothetical protein
MMLTLLTVLYATDAKVCVLFIAQQENMCPVTCSTVWVRCIVPFEGQLHI